MADRAVIMAGKPGEIKDELVIDIEGVRERHDPRVQAMRTRLMDAFQRAVDGAAASTVDALDEQQPARKRA